MSTQPISGGDVFATILLVLCAIANLAVTWVLLSGKLAITAKLKFWFVGAQFTTLSFHIVNQFLYLCR
jgi:hypothetical protein